jgi:hypothetical protein
MPEAKQLALSDSGVFGPWTVPGPPLSIEQLRSLPENTEVEIVWDGGNGPHRYLVIFDDRGEPYVVAPRNLNNPQMRYYNPIPSRIGPRPLTEVRRA